MEKTQRGRFKVEFYTLLPEIKKRFEDGIVVAKIIYNDLYETKKITMPYNAFMRYFKKEINQQKKSTSKMAHFEEKPVFQAMTLEKEEISENDPIILSVGGKKGSSFNPHTREINPEDIIGGNKFKKNT